MESESQSEFATFTFTTAQLKVQRCDIAHVTGLANNTLEGEECARSCNSKRCGGVAS